MSSMVQALVVVGGCQSFDLFQKEEKDVKIERSQWRALDCTPTMRMKTRMKRMRMFFPRIFFNVFFQEEEKKNKRHK